MGREFGGGSAEWFCLKVSPADAVQLLARLQLSEGWTGARGSGPLTGECPYVAVRRWTVMCGSLSVVWTRTLVDVLLALMIKTKLK